MSLAGVLAHLAPATVRLFKNESKAVNVIRLSGVIEQKSLDESKRTISGYITTVDCDRQGDVVVPAGMNCAPYMANPVVLMSHDYHSKPVAKTVKLKADDYGVRADMEFASSQDANETWELVKGGFLNAFSVGFVSDASIEKGRTGFDQILNAWMSGRAEKTSTGSMNPTRFITRSTLLEVSIVPVPCNETALIDYISKSAMTLSPGMMKRLHIEAVESPGVRIERVVHIERFFDQKAFVLEQVKKTLDTLRGRIA